MTTKQAEERYLGEHLTKWGGQRLAVHNPNDEPIEKLPVIYGFNNGGGEPFLSAVLLAEDGTYLGGHACSHEGYMPHDLGCVEGSRPDRHEEVFQKHYPDGYRMEFVGMDQVQSNVGLMCAYQKNQKKRLGP